ncbi:MAG: N-acetylneuraminate synthase [Negativicutes bacterium]|jgi:N-acetylneuraminate synthase
MFPNKPYFIAEAGVNHNGSLDIAKKLIEVAADAGADAVKFQTFNTELLVTKTAEKADYQTKLFGESETQYEMLKKLELSREEWGAISEYCKSKKIEFLSTPFDSVSLKFLLKHFDLPFVKIPSGEITNAPFLIEIAQTGKPVILSTGASTIGEIEAALGVLAFGYLFQNQPTDSKEFVEAFISSEGQRRLQEKVVLLHCTSDYPAPFEEVNLNAIDTLRSVFNLEVGYSDHTEGVAIPIAAAVLGAVVVEKHFTLDKNMPGPDHRASANPEELELIIKSIRQVQNSLGDGIKLPMKSETANRSVIRKSLVARKNIAAGEKIDVMNLSIKRPGDGISPMRYWELIGRTSDRNFIEDETL